jgi:polysaccharide pyruvyl transferase WcaK-like protein
MAHGIYLRATNNKCFRSFLVKTWISKMMRISKVALFDTSVCSENMGDLIICDSIRKILENQIPETVFITVPTHDYLSSESHRIISQCDLSIVCGTNLLSGNLETYNQWKIQYTDLLILRNIVLMGVGWWQYQEAISQYSSIFYKTVLSDSLPQSVRDSYTQNMLKIACPGKTILNTGCPTMWSLKHEKVKSIRENALRYKSNACITTVTDYKPNPECDSEMIKSLLEIYDQVFLWPQGTRDLEYLKSLSLQSLDNLRILSPTLSAYDSLLSSTSRIDFFGTRLHAGVRALQLGHPATIVAVDNRAVEISKDTGLPVCNRSTLISDSIQAHINSYSLPLTLPFSEIEAWLSSIKRKLMSKL